MSEKKEKNKENLRFRRIWEWGGRFGSVEEDEDPEYSYTGMFQSIAEWLPPQILSNSIAQFNVGIYL